MNGRVAKRIRKEIYQGESPESLKERGYKELLGGTLVCEGLRKKYQNAKKEYMKMKRCPSG